MTRPTDYLLIDISNSFTKLAFSSRKRMSQPERIATEKFNARYLRDVLRGRKIDRLVVCSVVPKKNREIKKVAGKTKVLWINARANLGVGIDYPSPGSIGADRLANAAAVTALYGCPAI